MKAKFTDIKWDAPLLTFRAVLGDLDKSIWVSLPDKTPRPNDDLIAGLFATMAGPNLESISMDLEISPPIKAAIERFCGCPVVSNVALKIVDWTTGFDGHAVSFSGGFDSLAALSLLPSAPALVSMDFGGWFKREADFFNTFHPHVVGTNFRMEGFGRRSWMFMLSGIILLKEQLNLGSYTTGSILESSPWHYKRHITKAFNATPLLSAFGFDQVNSTMGITEVATTILAMRHFPDRVEDSLESLAAPRSGKSLRKQMLVESLNREGKAAVSFNPEVTVLDTPPLKWGQSLTDDMLTPYMLKHSGVDATNRLMAEIPEEIAALSKNLDLDFYQRYHTGMYLGMDRKVREFIHLGLSQAGIDPFSERDWHEYRSVTKVIAKYHSVHID